MDPKSISCLHGLIAAATAEGTETGIEYLRWRAEQERCAIERAEAYERAKAIRSSVATLPDAFDWATFDAPELTARCGGVESVQRARTGLDALLSRKRIAVVLSGPAGCGKTSLACAMVRRAAQEGLHQCLFSDAYAIARAYRTSKLGSTPKLIEDTERAFLLVLDDLGSEKGDVETIRELVHDRHADGRPTIVTTWMDQAQLRERYGDGTARRLFERGVVLRMGGAQ